jgi:adenosylmethionine-8-amino-7-oxononanoate aminotransferase
VGLRNLQIFDDEGLVENAGLMGERLAEGIRTTLGEHSHVSNIRHLGLMAGLTLVRDASSGVAYEAAEGMGAKVARQLREEGGVVTRFVGDHIVFAPPLVVNESEVDAIVVALDQAVRAVTGD